MPGVMPADEKVQRGRQRSNEWSLWYDLKDGTWVELLRGASDPGGPDGPSTRTGLRCASTTPGTANPAI